MQGVVEILQADVCTKYFLVSRNDHGSNHVAELELDGDIFHLHETMG